jgi:sulfatase modifying factor 1
MRDRPVDSRGPASAAAVAVLVLAAAVAMSAASAARNAASPPGPEPAFVNSIGMAFHRVPAGVFRMGSDPGDRGHRVNEGPAHEVRIPRDFLMAETEVTIGQFARFVAATGHVTEAERDADGGFGIDWTTGRVVQARGIDFRDPGFPNFTPGPEHPAVLLSWSDAEAFCRWLSETEGRRYRLPTEAEWERAARGGTTGTWWFGEDPLGRANIADRSFADAVSWPSGPEHSDWNDGFAFLSPVGSFPANPYGLRDMHGNVWEWCAEIHDATAYARRTQSPHVDQPPAPPAASGSPGSETEPDPGFRVIRGGGWLNPVAWSRAAQRVYFTPTFRYCLLSGFRVVLEVSEDGEADSPRQQQSDEQPAGQRHHQH